MKHKFKALGLGVVAVVAITAFSGGSATATSGGHFVSGSEHTLLKNDDQRTARIGVQSP